jgi:hypothetical protein
MWVGMANNHGEETNRRIIVNLDVSNRGIEVDLC